MAKDRAVNPATAALKAEKKRSIKKNKSNVQAQRQERFAKRNPFRIEAQIIELKQAQEAGTIKPKDKQLLDQLQREHKAILKAREQLGDKAPVFRQPREYGDESRGSLGKRKRDEDDESETDDDAKGIPMPKDIENMPPAPRRRPRPPPSTNEDVDLSLPKKPELQSQAVYESAPVIKDLRKEAAMAFVPTAVKRNLKSIQGSGTTRLLEPEEMDRLEKAGYVDAQKAADEAQKEAEHEMMVQEVEDGGVEVERQLKRAGGEPLADELRAGAMRNAEMAVDEAVREAEYEIMRRELEEGFTGDAQKEDQAAEKSLRRVEIEEVEDEEG